MIGVYRNSIVICYNSEDIIEFNEENSDNELNFTFNFELIHPCTFLDFSLSKMWIKKIQSLVSNQIIYKSPLLYKPLMPPELNIKPLKLV